MKCPKCGYNSFEYLDSCKKCKNDLSAFKQAHGIRSAAVPAVAVAAASAVAVAAIAAAAPPAKDETFTWEEPATAPPPSSPAKPGDDIFPAMDLDFAPPPPAAPAAPPPLSFDLEPAMAAPAVPPAAEGIGLADFSFDEPAPEATAAPPALFGSEPVDDDGFASLLETGDSSEETAAAPAPAAAPELESAWEAPANVFGGFGEEQDESAGEAGELGLESFGWEEEMPPPAPQPPTGPRVELDGFSPTEFDSLFGEPDKQ